MYLLDTNVCIRLLNGSSAQVVKQLPTIEPSSICLCTIVKAELLYGAHHSSRVEKNLRHLADFCAPYELLPFDDTCAHHYAVLRASLASKRSMIGGNDLFIAATALAHDLTLVTHNTREFSRVPKLKIVDWE